LRFPAYILEISPAASYGLPAKPARILEIDVELLAYKGSVFTGPHEYDEVFFEFIINPTYPLLSGSAV
jgi:hypothetical protein